MRQTRLHCLFILLCCFLVVGFSKPVLGQRTLGVQWTPPENRQQAFNQLDSLQRLGVILLEISENPGPQIWEKINELEFRVYGKLSYTFPLVKHFAEADSAFMEKIRQAVNSFRDQPSVEALGIFTYGAIHDPDFDTSILPYLRDIGSSFDRSLYYTTAQNKTYPIDRSVDFKLLSVRVEGDGAFSVEDSLSAAVGGVIYHPKADISGYLTPFHTFVETFAGESVPLFVSSQWLFSILQKYPDFQNTVQLYNSDAEFVFPVPGENYRQAETSHSLIVLLLVLIWGILAVTYHMSPVYRKSAFRYFHGHLFFVEDVMQRHIRSIGASFTIICINIVLAGVVAYCVAQTLFSPLGVEALIHHYPGLGILPHPNLSLFFWAAVFSAILTATGILWIKFTNKSVKSFRQVLNLYAWPLQLNIALATVMVTLLMAGSYPRMTLFLALLFATVHILTFIVTAADTAKYVNKKGLFLVGSIVVYLLLWAGLGYQLSISSVPEVIQLAMHL